MNYSDSIQIFQSRLHTQAYNRKLTVKKLTHGEIMWYLALAQQYLADVYQLYEKAGTLDLTESQSLYTIGTGADDIPADLLKIKSAEINKDGDNKVTVTGKDDINKEAKGTGLPTKLTVYGTEGARVLEINSTPDYSYADDPEYRINYIYAAKTDLFDSNAGTSGTFEDYDETEAGYGGSWVIPSEWHALIIDLGLSEIYPDMKGQALQMAEKLCRDMKPKYVKRTLDYSMGFGD